MAKNKHKKYFTIKNNSNENKQKALFSFETNNKIIDMNVDESLYNHFQTLSPLHQKAMQDLMTLKLLQEMNDKKNI
jgi:hypothetical protein